MRLMTREFGDGLMNFLDNFSAQREASNSPRGKASNEKPHVLVGMAIAGPACNQPDEFSACETSPFGPESLENSIIQGERGV